MKRNMFIVFFCFMLCTAMEQIHIQNQNTSIQRALIATLQEINNNNEQFLSCYTLSKSNIKKFNEYTQLNQKRRNDLEHEEYNSLTLPAMIILNSCLAQEYHQLTNQNNEYYNKHLHYLKKLKTLSKSSQ